ncbi:peptidylprolyl isomerase [Paenibacillus glycanilyticus]|uniref:peptidylprolyl isomerase n=1 Tax=Paenibacillus glycanilyticus TaxID=126569 RepID=A0ABQ6GKJ3_9BACL|nr:peptidylprolyl isomerase [Paenibacillus glycanilyticus]GLX71446.1 peptidylprolyl isomerase [Paenibacillus glycanilyticus]
MKKHGVLKAVVVLQAICMIVLSVAVIVKLSPFSDDPEPLDPDSETKAEAGDKPSEGIAATVGGVPISEADLVDQLRRQYGDNVLRTMMVHKAIDLEADAQKLNVTSEEEDRELASMIEGYDSEEVFYEVMQEQLGMTKTDVREDVKYRLLLEKIAILTVNLSEVEIQNYITEHSSQFEGRLRLHLQWIVTDSEKEAEEVLDRLGDGDSFDQLAITYSNDANTSESAGDLGLIDSDDPFYDAGMLEEASRLQTGETTGPIQVPQGYAIIRLLERQKTEGLTGHILYDSARKELALSKAKPLNEIEDDLLEKYNADITP